MPVTTMRLHHVLCWGGFGDEDLRAMWNGLTLGRRRKRWYPPEDHPRWPLYEGLYQAMRARGLDAPLP